MGNTQSISEDKLIPTKQDSNNILKLKYEYNHILGESIDNLFLKLKQRHFELGVKKKQTATQEDLNHVFDLLPTTRCS